MEVIIDYGRAWACSSAWLFAVSSNVALPTTIVTSPCKNDRTVERVSWSVFNWKYTGDCIYLRWSTGLRLLDLLLGGLSSSPLSLSSALLLRSLLGGEGGVLALRRRLLSLGAGGDGGAGGGGGGGGGASAGSGGGGAGAGAAGSATGSSGGAGASAGGACRFIFVGWRTFSKE